MLNDSNKKLLASALTLLLKKLNGGVKVGDAEGEHWVTLSNGKAVQLDGNGDVVKGMGGKQEGKNVKEAAKEMKTAAGGSATSAASAARHGSEAKTPSGVDKSSLDMRDKAALSNAGKFNSLAMAKQSKDGQKYNTNILKGEGGQFWVPSTNREESILRRLGYTEHK